MPGETPMNCEDVRIRLLDYQRGRLTRPGEAEVRTHLNGCADCTRADAVEQELTSVLEHRLPQHPARSPPGRPRARNRGRARPRAPPRRQPQPARGMVSIGSTTSARP